MQNHQGFIQDINVFDIYSIDAEETWKNFEKEIDSQFSILETFVQQALGEYYSVQDLRARTRDTYLLDMILSLEICPCPVVYVCVGGQESRDAVKPDCIIVR